MSIQGMPNMLSQLNFAFNIKKAPLTSAMTFEVTTPEITTGFAVMPTPFMDQAFTPDKLAYGDVAISFKIDENLDNYNEMLNWIKGIAFPNSFTQYRTAAVAPNRDGLYSDATLSILTSSANPSVEYGFIDMFPISLSGIRVNSQDQDVDYLAASVIFKIRDFTLGKPGTITNS